MKTKSEWLIKKGATPTEMQIYNIAVRQYRILKKPLRNADIASVHETDRTNIRTHLKNMIEKGLIKRHLQRYYLPVEYA